MFVKGPVVRKSPASSSGKQDDTNGNASEVSAREKLLSDQPELLQQFGMDLLPVLIQVIFFGSNSYILLVLVSLFMFQILSSRYMVPVSIAPSDTNVSQ